MTDTNFIKWTIVFQEDGRGVQLLGELAHPFAQGGMVKPRWIRELNSFNQRLQEALTKEVEAYNELLKTEKVVPLKRD